MVVSLRDQMLPLVQRVMPMPNHLKHSFHGYFANMAMLSIEKKIGFNILAMPLGRIAISIWCCKIARNALHAGKKETL